MSGKTFRMFGQRPGHGRSSIKQGLPVDTEKSSRQKPHRRQSGITAAKVVGHFKRRESELSGFFAEKTLLQIRHHNHVLLPVFAKGFLQPVTGKEILGNRLNGAAGLADGDDHGVSGIKTPEPFRKGVGINIIRDPQAASVRTRSTGHILSRSESALHGPGTER